ncbi:hypothetical protein BJ912DRAFT_864238, partial [Pholiota molesta]
MTILQFEVSCPIGRIPCEIVREIFIHCLPHHYLDSDLIHTQPNAMVAPMLLCQICSSWRQIALEYPALWSHLAFSLAIINDSFSSALVLKRQLEFLSFW